MGTLRRPSLFQSRYGDAPGSPGCLPQVRRDHMLTLGRCLGATTTKVHNHPSGQGRPAPKHPDPGQCHTSHDQERDRVYQPPSECVCPLCVTHTASPQAELTHPASALQGQRGYDAPKQKDRHARRCVQGAGRHRVRFHARARRSRVCKCAGNHRPPPPHCVHRKDTRELTDT